MKDYAEIGTIRLNNSELFQVGGGWTTIELLIGDLVKIDAFYTDHDQIPKKQFIE